MSAKLSLGQFAIRNATAITFITVALCLAGIYSALQMPSSVFPQTNFPRCVVLIDNGVMPAQEMMATITRPIEEAMKDVPGTVSVRSATGRGSAEVNVFFNWQVDMLQAELQVNSRLAQVRSALPATATTAVWRLTFAAFPIIGVSLTSSTHDITRLWEIARYDIKPQFLTVPGVARVDLVGGRAPEYHVVVDPLRLSAARLSLSQITDALVKTNLIAPTGLHEEDHTLYLTVVDGRVHDIDEIENVTVAVSNGRPFRVKDFARVERAPEPVFNVVTAEGVNAVLLNIRSQSNGSTLDIADGIANEIRALQRELPPGAKLSFFYDQSLLVRASVRSVWEAIFFGLILSIVIIYLFLKNWGTTLTAIVVIPVTVLITLAAMRVAGLSFNLMTLGGIAAAIGLVIDDAIVVVEAIYAKCATGVPRIEAIGLAIAEIFRPLVASTLTPVVVFIPLVFLDGITGVFFRALALTMVVSLLTSLALAILLTPSLASWLVRDQGRERSHEDTGFLFAHIVRTYETALRSALQHKWSALTGCFLLILFGIVFYKSLENDFLPPMDEGGFVIDYHTPYGTSLTETNRQLLQAEEILRLTPEVESYSRRTGARLALALTESNKGDFLVKLKTSRKRSTDEIIAELRRKFRAAVPGVEWDFAGILSDLIGDLTWSPKPIEVKIFSTDAELLKRKASDIAAEIKQLKGVVDVFDGLVYAGPTLSLRVRSIAAQRFGLTPADVAAAVNTAMLGQQASSVLEGDRVVRIRVRVDNGSIGDVATLYELPLRAPDGSLIKLSQVADVIEIPSQLELRREDLRQDVAVTARLEGRDLGSAMVEIREQLSADKSLTPGMIEFGDVPLDVEKPKSALLA